MVAKENKNGAPFFLQIGAYRQLIADALDAQADQVKQVAAQDGIPQVMKSTEDFLHAAATEVRGYSTSE